MTARRYDAVVLDVDGTLLADDERVHPRTRAALGRAVAAGVRVMLATGRSAGSTREVLQDLALDTRAVVYNGAAVYCPLEDRVVEHSALPEQLVQQVLALAERTALLPIVALPDGAQYSRPGRTAEERRVLADFRSLAVVEPSALPTAGALRVTLLSDRHETSRALRREIEAVLPAPAYLTDFALSALPRFRDSRQQIVDIQPECPGKAEAFRVLYERYGIAKERVVAVGDAGNDLPMLREAGLGVAMGNATDEAKRAAHRVIGDNNGDALGALLDELFPS